MTLELFKLEGVYVWHTLIHMIPKFPLSCVAPPPHLPFSFSLNVVTQPRISLVLYSRHQFVIK